MTEENLSPMVVHMIEVGQNAIIAMKNNKKDNALALLDTLWHNCNDYYKASKLAIQADVYNYIKNAKLNTNIIQKYKQKNNSTPQLILPAIEMPPRPNERTAKDINLVEDYSNAIIKYVKNIEKMFCNARNKFLFHNHQNLIEIGKNRTYNRCVSNDLKEIVRYMVPVD